ncbi:MAG: hypothetical protein M5U26_16465 [Planctomycetota bacterium]|nr:hypothetical protein [Planctomycetota bacterium]
MEIKVPIPKDLAAQKTLDIHGESQTYYGTKFPWVIHFSGAALESLDSPPKPDLKPRIKPIRFTVNRRYKALYANVSPAKVEFTDDAPPKDGSFVIEIQNKLTELEQMIFEIKHL